MSIYSDFKAYYSSILGKNIYSKNLRQYVYSAYEDGKFYSDCSSSICATFKKCGLGVGLLNTAGMHNSSLAKIVPVIIKNGHIQNPSILKVGDCLMFRGNDPSRPLQIGHVEAVYQIDGDQESDITICGHGSNTPSLKNMLQYCESREKSKASNGKSKGLVEVLRFIPETDSTIGLLHFGDVIYPDKRYSDLAEYDISTTGLKCTEAALRIRREPDYAVSGKWFHIGDGYCSARCFEGWVFDSQVGKWWYLKDGYNYLTKTVETLNGADYAFGSDGYMVDNIAGDGHIIY